MLFGTSPSSSKTIASGSALSRTTDMVGSCRNISGIKTARARLFPEICWAVASRVDGDQGAVGDKGARNGERRECNAMNASDIAQRHFSAAVDEAETSGLGYEPVCRSLLNLVISKYLETRSV